MIGVGAGVTFDSIHALLFTDVQTPHYHAPQPDVRDKVDGVAFSVAGRVTPLIEGFLASAVSVAFPR